MPRVLRSSDEGHTPTTGDASTPKKRGVKTGTKRGKYNKTCTRRNNRIIKAAKKDWDRKAVAKTKRVPIQTAYGWIRRSGKQRKKHGGPRYAKVYEEHVKKMIECVEENPVITLREICAKLAMDTGVTVSINTVCRHLKGQLYTVKKTLPEPADPNAKENKKKRKEYVEKVMNRIELGKTVIYVDETNANLFLQRSVGRPRKDLHCVPKCPVSKGNNVHILGSISQDGPVYWERRRGSYRKGKCQEWLRKMLRMISEPLSNVVVVCGNAPVFSGIECIAKEKEFVGLEIIHMSPCSAPLNPIKECWSVMKAAMKQELAQNFALLMDNPADTTQMKRCIQFLERCIDDAVANMTPAFCLKTCKHVLKHFPGVLQMKDLDVGDK